MKKLILAILATVAWAGDAQLIRIGNPGFGTPAGATASNASINAAGVKIGFVFMSQDAAVMTHFQYRYSAPTGTPVQHRISLQQVDGSGLPDGTILAAAAFTPIVGAGNNGLILEEAITNDAGGGSISSYTMARGTSYSIVIEACPGATAPCSGAVSGSGGNNAAFTVAFIGLSARPGNQYYLTHNGTSWSKQAEQPVFGYRSASRSYAFPIKGVTSTAISVGSESGMSFTLSTDICSTFKVVGAALILTTPAAAKSIKVVLYSGTTVLQSTVAMDSDQNSAAGSAFRSSFAYFSDVTLTSLSCGVLYRIGVSPQNASNNVALSTMDTGTAGDRTAFPGGTMFAFASRSGCVTPCDSTSTAWAADTTTTRPLIDLILDEITQAGGAGGQKGFAFVQ